MVTRMNAKLVGLAMALVTVAMVVQTRAGFPENWRFVNAFPQGNNLNTVWAAGPNDVFMGGDGGVIVRWDGTNWTQMKTPTQKTIYGIHGLSATNIWAVGGDAYTLNQMDHSLILHYDGKEWKEQTAPNFSGYTYTITSVHAVSATDVWATQSGGTSMMHFNGQTWDFEFIPLSLEGQFNSVTSVGTNLFVVGDHGQILRRAGDQWYLEMKEETGSISFNILYALWGSDLDHVYAGGNWGQMYRRNSDGTWTSLETNTGFGSDSQVKSIVGVSSTEMYLVGNNTIRRFSGTKESMVPYSFESKMRGTWMAATLAGQKVILAGNLGIAHEFDISGTTPVLSPLTAGNSRSFPLQVSGATPCGTNGLLMYGTAGYEDPRSPIHYFDGFAFHAINQLPTNMEVGATVTAALAENLTNYIIAWQNVTIPGGGVHRWNGSAWEELHYQEYMPMVVNVFWKSPTGKIYAATDAMEVKTWENGSGWTSLPSPYKADEYGRLTVLWGRSDSDIFAGSQEGKIFHFNGVSWTSETVPTQVQITAISGTASDVYAVGTKGAAWRRSGTSWQPVASVTSYEYDVFRSLVVKSNSVYALLSTSGQYTGGGLSEVWKFTGNTGTQIIKGVSHDLGLMVADGSENIFGLSSGLIISDSPRPTDFSMKQIDLTSTQWTSLGTSGIDVRLDAPAAGHCMVASWRLDQPSDVLPTLDKDDILGRQQWVFLGDMWYNGAALPAVAVRMHYNPSLLPTGFNSGSALLFGVDNGIYQGLSAIFDASSTTLTLAMPTQYTFWTLGSLQQGPVPPPQLTISKVTGGKVKLSWPESATGFTLETNTKVNAATSWVSTSITPEVSGGMQSVTIDTISGPHFFRLRK